MVKQEVILCDVCNKKVAKYRCRLCGKDLCEDCHDYFSIEISGSYPDGSGIIGNRDVSFCKECKKKIIDYSKKKDIPINEGFLRDTEERFVDYIKKELILNKLDEGEKKDA